MLEQFSDGEQRLSEDKHGFLKAMQLQRQTLEGSLQEVLK